MEIYLVGGAVRDALLSIESSEKDWVVVGATPEDMVELGYRPVGKDFPVFLHPETGEEYALARTERKQGHGYKGFVFNCSPEVTLEDDLWRRDLTINAIARKADGSLVDPHGGQEDLAAKKLRHVSAAFAEDPLRVLRTARFAAKFAHLGFAVSNDTITLMQQISTSGELKYLAAERIFSELRRALETDSPEKFIGTLRDCSALQELLPEVNALFGVPQTETHHPEVDAGVHVMLCLQLAAELGVSSEIRFALLLHDLGKAVTPKQQLPSHIGHERTGLPLVRTVCERFRVPNNWRDLALLVCEFHLQCHRAAELKPSTKIKLLERADAFRKPQRFEEFLLACELDARGREGRRDRAYPQRQMLSALATSCANIDTKAMRSQGKEGKALGEAIRDARVSIASQSS